jgi:hypothetical protein
MEAVSDTFIKVTIRIPRKYDAVTKEIAENRHITYSDVVREFFRSIIEGNEFFKGEYSGTKEIKAKVTEVVFCQSCGDEIVGIVQPVKYRDDVFKFCNRCFLTEEYKKVLQRVAKTYEY